MAILTSSQLTFVDITDQRQLSAYLTSNKTTVQIYDTDNQTYSPSWASANLIITPQVFLDQASVALDDKNLTITWKKKDGNGNEVTLSTTGESVTGNILTVTTNKLGNTTSDMLTYICYVKYHDAETAQDVNVTTQLTYTLIRTAEKTKSCSISGAQIFKYDKDNQITGDTQITLTAILQNVTVSKWQYCNASGNFVDYPTTPENTNINSGTLVVKYTHTVFNSNVAKIKLVTSDADVYDVISITKVYDGPTGGQGDAGKDSYTIYLTNESHTFPGTTDAAVASNTTTLVYAYKGTTEQTVKINKVDNVTAMTTQTNTGVTGLQFKVSSTSAVQHPTITFYALETLTIQSGTIPINMTVDGVTFTKNFSWSVARTGSGACSISLSASSQIFKSSDGVSFSPDSISITPTLQNLTASNCAWAYSVNGGGSYTNITSTTASTTAPYISDNTNKIVTVPNGCTLFTDVITTIVFKCTNGSYSDTMTICRLSDGQSAAAAYTVILSNETQTISTNTSLQPLSAKTYSCTIQVYEGTNLLSPTLSTPGEGTFKVVLPSNPTGLTLAQSTAGTVTFTTTTSTAIADSGSIDLSIQVESTSNVITKSISYSAAKAGTNGSNAVVFRVYSTNGTVFSNRTGSITLSTSAYSGSTEITSGATYQWAQYTSGSWVNISGQTAKTCTIQGSSVTNIASFRCTMTYGGKSYVDVITLEDKSDTYVSELLTIGGTTFKNGQGGSFVYAIVRTNNEEQDKLLGPLSTTQKQNSETTTTGYYYYLNITSGAIQLYKYTNSAWSTSTDPQSLTYTWSLMDRYGNADAFANSSATKTGKIIYLSCDDIDGIGTLQCEVSPKS